MTHSYSWADVLGSLSAGTDLTEEQCRQAMSEIVEGRATSAQIAAFVMGLRVKGETASEVAGLVDAMLDHAEPLAVERPALDVVGTGGDLADTVNISTISAIVAAAAGAVVVKHGNRAASSACGSADVLEALGVRVDLPAADVSRCIAELDIGFCFAPVFHPAMRHAGPTRRELGIPTVFNILGPLSNPARPAASLIGAADQRLAPVMAEVFARRGLVALIVRGQDGLDEVTVGGDTDVWDVTDSSQGVRGFSLSPSGVGLSVRDPEHLIGADAAFNASVATAVLSGKGEGQLASVRDAVILNTAAALVAYDAATGERRYGATTDSVSTRVAAAVPAAWEAIASGAAAEKLTAWAELSRSLAG